jgi:hypothetical protein
MNICRWATSAKRADHEVSEFAEGDEIIKLAGDYRMAVRDCKGMLKGTFAK